MRSLLCCLLIGFGVVAQNVEVQAKIIACVNPLRVPQIAFEKSTVRDAALKLRAAVITRHAHDINIIFDLPLEGGRLVSLQAEDSTAEQILKEIARQGECEIYVEPCAVVFRRKGAGPIPPIRGEPAVVKFWQEWLAPVVLPRVDFRDASLREAIDFIVQKSKQLGPERGMNLVGKLDGASAAGTGVPTTDGGGIPGLSSVEPPVTKQPPQLSTISMEARDIPILELLRCVAGMAGCEVTADKHRLTFAPVKREADADPKSQGGGRKVPAKTSKRKANR